MTLKTKFRLLELNKKRKRLRIYIVKFKIIKFDLLGFKKNFRVFLINPPITKFDFQLTPKKLAICIKNILSTQF